MNPDWRNQPATEYQKEKLRFFGCTWDEGITAGQSKDALEECAKQFPDVEAAYLNRPKATEQQDASVSQNDTVGETRDGTTPPALKSETSPPSTGTPAFQENQALPALFSPEPKPSDSKYQDCVTAAERDYCFDLDHMRWKESVEQIKAQIEAERMGRPKCESIRVELTQQAIKRQDEKPHETPESTPVFVRPTPEQFAKIRSFGKKPTPGLTYQEAAIWIEQCKILCPTKPEVEDQKQWPEPETKSESTPVFVPPTPEQFAAIRSFGKVPPPGLTYQEAAIWIEQCKILYPAESQSESPRESIEAPLQALQEITLQEAAAGAIPPIVKREGFFYKKPIISQFPVRETENVSPQEVTIQEAVKPQNPGPGEYDIPTQPQASQEPEKISTGIELQIAQLSDSDKSVRRSAALALGQSQDSRVVRPLIFSCMNDDYWGVRVQAAQSLGVLKNPDAVQALIGLLLRDSEFYVRSTAADALGQITDTRSIDALTEALKDTSGTVRGAAALALTRINEKIPSQAVQNFAPRQRAGQKTAASKLASPIERFSKEVDGLLKRNQTCLGGHWLPAGPLDYVFTFDAITIGLCRQMADAIESKGYCVEPDARFSSGTYDSDQTLALFKPLDGDPIQPSTAYLGAANLLRLCVLTATADGRVNIEELDVYRQAIENQTGLTRTDHKRLLILEQLLTQELCPPTKTAAKIAKSVSPDKRFVIGKLLVEVAAANNFITNGERRVLEGVFEAIGLRPDFLKALILEICPRPQRDVIQQDVSERDKLLWQHWRTGHPGVVIDDFTLAQKRWNFNDWKALNWRWRTLHERLVARQKEYGKSPPQEVTTREVGTGSSVERIVKSIAAPAPQAFALDMARVYEITNETREVVAILSAMMEDEPEESIAPTASSILPAAEISKNISDDKTAPQPTRFNGLDAAFHSILERLLSRDSWSQADFNSLAREFHFMPLNIRDTINEWADEVLGDFILDGEDPVIIRRDLIEKGKD